VEAAAEEKSLVEDQVVLVVVLLEKVLVVDKQETQVQQIQVAEEAELVGEVDPQDQEVPLAQVVLVVKEL
jgi:hypothetical protein